jgi:hypothetical protein
MKTLLRCALATTLAASVSAPAAAGELRLTMANGRVTLVAHDVTVRQILAEWARVGQARIVNGEKLTGGPVTIELTDVPEARALDTVLRSAAGYVMAPRTPGAPGTSQYDRIMILATSRAPATPAGNAAPFANRPMPQLPQNQPAQATDDDGDFTPPPVVPANGPMMGQPGPGMMPQPQPQPGAFQQPAGPMTAPRPGMLPPPTPQPAMNPYLGTPPGNTFPTAQPPTVPGATRPPGGPGGAGSE